MNIAVEFLRVAARVKKIAKLLTDHATTPPPDGGNVKMPQDRPEAAQGFVSRCSRQTWEMHNDVGGRIDNGSYRGSSGVVSYPGANH